MEKLILPHCLRVEKSTLSKKMNLVKTNKGKLIILLKCAVCNSKKSRFMKKQEADGLLSCLRSKTPLSKILALVLVDHLLKKRKNTKI